MRITETFVAGVPPEVVFDYMVEPANLAKWQTSKTLVEQLTEGSPQLGTRVRERTAAPRGKEFEQLVEFTQFDRPRRLHVHVVEGPYPIDGTWELRPDGGSTVVTFTAEGTLRGPVRLATPLLKRVLARQFAEYHRQLCRNVEQLPAPERN
jgi:uncharacterized protein YndB with AHSA1/START domain